MRDVLKQLVGRIPDDADRNELRGSLGDAPESDDVPKPLLSVLWSKPVSAPLCFGHFPLTLDHAVSEKVMMDELLASGAFDGDPTGDMDQDNTDSPYEAPWWSVDWWPFMSDGAGQLICWDQKLNRVVEFLHDDPCREEWIDTEPLGLMTELQRRLVAGDAHWRKHLGFMTAEQLDAIDAFAQRQEERKQQRKADEQRATTQFLKFAGLLLLVALVAALGLSLIS